MITVPGHDAWQRDCTLRRFLALVMAAIYCVTARAAGQCGFEWTAGPGQTCPGVGGIVQTAVTFDPDGAGPVEEWLVVSGDVDTAGDQVGLGNVAAFDGDRWFAIDGVAFDAAPLSLVVAQGRLYAAGGFTSLHGQSGVSVAEFDVATRRWNAIGVGFDGAIADADILNGELVVAGAFTHIGNGAINANYIAAWDGTAWRELRDGEMNGLVRGPVQEMCVASQTLMTRCQNGWEVLENDLWRAITSPGSVTDLHSANGSATALYTEVVGGQRFTYVLQWQGGAWSVVTAHGGKTFDGVNGRSYSTVELGAGISVWGQIIRDGSLGMGGNLLTLEGGYAKVILGFQGDVVIVGGLSRVGTVPVANVARLRSGTWEALGTGPSGMTLAITQWRGRPVATRQRRLDRDVETSDVFELGEDGMWQPLGRDTLITCTDGGGLFVFNETLYLTGNIQLTSQPQLIYLAEFDGTNWSPGPAGLPFYSSFFELDHSLYSFSNTTGICYKLNPAANAWEPAWSTQAHLSGITVSAGVLYAFGYLPGQSQTVLTRSNGVWLAARGLPSAWNIIAVSTYQGRPVVSAYLYDSNQGSSYFFARWDGITWNTLGPIPGSVSV